MKRTEFLEQADRMFYTGLWHEERALTERDRFVRIRHRDLSNQLISQAFDAYEQSDYDCDRKSDEFGNSVLYYRLFSPLKQKENHV